jgi:hypothetical protein
VRPRSRSANHSPPPPLSPSPSSAGGATSVEPDTAESTCDRAAGLRGRRGGAAGADADTPPHPPPPPSPPIQAHLGRAPKGESPSLADQAAGWPAVLSDGALASCPSMSPHPSLTADAHGPSSRWPPARRPTRHSDDEDAAGAGLATGAAAGPGDDARGGCGRPNVNHPGWGLGAVDGSSLGSRADAAAVIARSAEDTCSTRAVPPPLPAGVEVERSGGEVACEGGRDVGP